MAAAPERRSPTFRYWFNHLTADWVERDCYNISHDAEIPYIFRDAHAVPFWLGYGSFSADEEKLSAAISTMWRNMAAEGAPHSKADQLSPVWPPYTGGTAGLFEFSLSPKVIEFPVGEFCQHWDALVNASGSAGTKPRRRKSDDGCTDGGCTDRVESVHPSQLDELIESSLEDWKASRGHDTGSLDVALASMRRLYEVAREPTLLLSMGHAIKDWVKVSAEGETAASAASLLGDGIAAVGCSDVASREGLPRPYYFQQADFFQRRLTCVASHQALLDLQATASVPEAVLDAQDFPWLRRLQEGAVMEELQSFVGREASQRPFREAFSSSWTLTNRGDVDDWSAVELMNKGVLADGTHCQHLPITCDILSQLAGAELAPTRDVQQVGVRLLRLAPGAGLRPHHGPGGRLVAHLGLRIPHGDTTSLTVAGQRLLWNEGEWTVFDDAFLHSAHNGAPEERVVLSVAFVKPELAPRTRALTIDTDLFSFSIDSAACTATTSIKFAAPVPSKASAAVPLLSLYNRISDAQLEDFSDCIKVEASVDVCSASGKCKDEGELTVHAAHGYGSVQLRYRAAPTHVVFTLADTAKWKGDPVEKHLRFGEFWQGILPSCIPTDGNCTAPTVMGKIQGPRGFGGVGSATLPSSGFVSITNHSYYKYLFYATPNDSVGFTIAPSDTVAKVWMDIGRAAGVLTNNDNRFKSWLWTQGNPGPSGGVFDKKHWVNRSLALGVQLLFISSAINVEDWHINTKEYPTIKEDAAYVRSHGLGFGIHTLPYPPGNAPPEMLIQDGLAPTYRSGHWSSPSSAVGLEDMGK